MSDSCCIGVSLSSAPLWFRSKNVKIYIHTIPRIVWKIKVKNQTTRLFSLGNSTGTRIVIRCRFSTSPRLARWPQTRFNRVGTNVWRMSSPVSLFHRPLEVSKNRPGNPLKTLAIIRLIVCTFAASVSFSIQGLPAGIRQVSLVSLALRRASLQFYDVLIVRNVGWHSVSV